MMQQSNMNTGLRLYSPERFQQCLREEQEAPPGKRIRVASRALEGGNVVIVSRGNDTDVAVATAQAFASFIEATMGVAAVVAPSIISHTSTRPYAKLVSTPRKAIVIYFPGLWEDFDFKTPVFRYNLTDAEYNKAIKLCQAVAADPLPQLAEPAPAAPVPAAPVSPVVAPQVVDLTASGGEAVVEIMAVVGDII